MSPHLAAVSSKVRRGAGKNLLFQQSFEILPMCMYVRVSVRSIVTIISGCTTRAHIVTGVNAPASVQSFRPDRRSINFNSRTKSADLRGTASLHWNSPGPPAARKYLIRFTFTTGCGVQGIQAISNSSSAAALRRKIYFYTRGASGTAFLSHSFPLFPVPR